METTNCSAEQPRRIFFLNFWLCGLKIKKELMETDHIILVNQFIINGIDTLDNFLKDVILI